MFCGMANRCVKRPITCLVTLDRLKNSSYDGKLISETCRSVDLHMHFKTSLDPTSTPGKAFVRILGKGSAHVNVYADIWTGSSALPLP